MTQDVNADYVSSPQAAKILRITYVGVAQLARQGKIPAVKIANRWLIPRAFLEEFARTYEGRRGRPRKKGPLVEAPEVLATVQTGQPVSVNSVAATEVLAPGPESGESGAIYALAVSPKETPTPTTLPREAVPVDATVVGEAGDSKPDSLPPLVVSAPIGQPEDIITTVPLASEHEMREAAAVSQAMDTRPPHDSNFSIRAEVYHLDKNYDFELYEKGEITEQARLIVARLKPKIPSLPQFSFRWDYRYEHLNVDIHGVDHAVVDWWTMGENGYTGHLPMKLGGPGHAFEANIWLPVTFVFRGRLTLSFGERPKAEEDSSSVATTTGGLRKLWAKWPTIRHGE